MKKSKLERKLDTMIKEYAFQELNNKKDSHSKVKNIEHKRFEMQAYLTANKLKISQIEAQEIFKIRCRVTDVKANFRGKYEDFECKICNENLEENQEHILKCKILNKFENEKNIEYGEILKSDVKKQIRIVRKFLENMKYRKKFKEV